MTITRADIEACIRRDQDELDWYRENRQVLSARAFEIRIEAMKFQLEKGYPMNDKTSEVTSRPPADSEAGWFCVIGPNVTQNHPIQRSWKTDQESAAKHAEKLITNSVDGRGSAKTRRLLVVKVVEVVEIAGPPITRRTASAITPDDVSDPEGD